jgi:ComEC/Rec2-related protein
VPAAAYAVRERLADALGRGISDVRDRRLVQAMAFGYRKRLDEDLRDQFVRGGIIHVFAISGLHVGILALLATWYLCIVGVPLRLRGILLVLGVGAYVYMCGASASAVRAWLMLACWWGARLLRRPRVPLNVIAVAALLCLVWQPLSLLQTGFLFSFTVVAVLVYGWPLVSEWLLVLRERGAWLPRARRRDHGGRWRMWPAQAGATSLLAWSGSAGLVAASNGLLVPVGILLNLFVALLCTIILALAVVKIPLSLLGVGLADVSLGWLLGLCSGILRALAKLGGLPHASIRLAPPPALLVLGYYGLLLAILRQRRPTAWQPAALAVGVAALVLPTILGGAGPNGCRLVAGDGSPAPAAILNGAGRGSATVVNTGGWAGARAVATTLTERGVSELDAIICTNGRWDTCGGVGTLLDHWPVATLVVPAHYRRSSTLREAVACQRTRGGRVRLLEAGDEPLRLGNLSVAVTGPTSEQEIRFLRAMGGREQPILALRGLPSGEVQVEPAATGAGDGPQTLRRSTCPTALFVPEP